MLERMRALHFRNWASVNAGVRETLTSFLPYLLTMRGIVPELEGPALQRVI